MGGGGGTGVCCVVVGVGASVGDYDEVVVGFRIEVVKVFSLYGGVSCFGACVCL